MLISSLNDLWTNILMVSPNTTTLFFMLACTCLPIMHPTRLGHLTSEFFAINFHRPCQKKISPWPYDTLKKHIDFKPLFSKIGKMFSSTEKAETFVKEICERKGTGSLGHDINKLYTEISGEQAPPDLFPILSDWAKENVQNIKNISEFSASQISGFVIGSQTAGRDINMIQGNYYANPQKDEDWKAAGVWLYL